MILDNITFVGPHRVAQLRYLKEDGTPHREGRDPGADLSDLPEDAREKIEAEWTPEIIAAYREAMAEMDLPEGPVLLDYGVFRRRWTDDELAGLFAIRNTVWQVDDYIGLAQAQGHVNLSGRTGERAKALFVKLGVLTAERAAAIFATETP